MGNALCVDDLGERRTGLGSEMMAHVAAKMRCRMIGECMLISARHGGLRADVLSQCCMSCVKNHPLWQWDCGEVAHVLLCA